MTGIVSYQYINDIVDLFEGSDVRVKLYTDDIKIYLEIINDTVCAILLYYKLLLIK